ncbi:MAG TPA: aldo/keto reductase [Verrucomicrobiae bacterium]|nr:aldo/keto reductase [Verrucomicrobiae bacterium]
MKDRHLTDPQRRFVLQALAAAAVAGAAPFDTAAARPTQDGHGRDADATTPGPLLKPIPATGEKIPAIGMGTWLTFNVAPYTEARDQRVEVVRAFLDAGGTVVDSSPMYGLAEAAVGHCREKLGGTPALFAATKVWIPTRIAGVAQMNLSMKLWGLAKMDLMQIHNLLDWEAHLPTLREWKAAGRIRYIGITTSHGRRHDDMLEIIEKQKEFDAVQFSYSVHDRVAEDRLLRAAADRGKAVLINRPFRTGKLFELAAGKPLPAWTTAELDCHSWAQFFLKFVISHPAVTCAIPATTSVAHMRENMQALRGPLPDPEQRQRMADDWRRLVPV